MQATPDQQRAATRLHLPFTLLSDAEYTFTESLELPTFDVGGLRLLKRVTLIAYQGRIVNYFYPVFPPDKNAIDVIDWLTVQAH